MENYKLLNGLEIPAIGFGCYNAKKDGKNYEMLVSAIKNGYRFFDTASVYETERDLGRAIKDTGVDRKELFIQSKLWIDEMGYDNAKAAFNRTLNRLGTDYLDVYLIHWPRQNSECSDEEWKALDLETYRALEELYAEGKIKGIGLSNFLPHHLSNILENCKVKPVVVQLEYHLGYTQEFAVRFAQENGLRVQAWSPLARGAIYESSLISQLAEKYKVSPSQLALRFIIQSGVIPLPKAGSSEHQLHNLDVFNFELSQDDYYKLATIPQTQWLNEHPDSAIPSRKSNFNQ